MGKIGGLYDANNIPPSKIKEPRDFAKKMELALSVQNNDYAIFNTSVFGLDSNRKNH